ncbi:hypothetical protein DFS34DRAFT_593236 [Phlyctochytrium arcticum]|nr:hypothetical protein DFS34DRAFT_593236 [Phlyctochytrium arcticum]
MDPGRSHYSAFEDDPEDIFAELGRVAVPRPRIAQVPTTRSNSATGSNTHIFAEQPESRHASNRPALVPETPRDSPMDLSELRSVTPAPRVKKAATFADLPVSEPSPEFTAPKTTRSLSEIWLSKEPFVFKAATGLPSENKPRVPRVPRPTTRKKHVPRSYYGRSALPNFFPKPTEPKKKGLTLSNFRPRYPRTEVEMTAAPPEVPMVPEVPEVPGTPTTATAKSSLNLFANMFSTPVTEKAPMPLALHSLPVPDTPTAPAEPKRRKVEKPVTQSQQNVMDIINSVITPPASLLPPTPKTPGINPYTVQPATPASARQDIPPPSIMKAQEELLKKVQVIEQRFDNPGKKRSFETVENDDAVSDETIKDRSMNITNIPKEAAVRRRLIATPKNRKPVDGTTPGAKKRPTFGSGPSDAPSFSFGSSKPIVPEILPITVFNMDLSASTAPPTAPSTTEALSEVRILTYTCQTMTKSALQEAILAAARNAPVPDDLQFNFAPPTRTVPIEEAPMVLAESEQDAEPEATVNPFENLSTAPVSNNQMLDEIQSLLAFIQNMH